jgi:hypothetical protein
MDQPAIPATIQPTVRPGHQFEGSNTALLALIAVNLIPLAGVMLWGWSLFEVLFLYWCETLIIGGITVLKMLTAMPDLEGEDGLRFKLPNGQMSPPVRLPGNGANFMLVIKLVLIPFFIFHFGMFCMGHATFLFAMFSDGAFGTSESVPIEELLSMPLLLVVGALVASHLLSFFVNYLGSGEFRKTNPMELMMSPYKRIVVMHLTIIFGAFGSMLLGSPIGLIALLVVLKIATDVRSHWRERRRYAGLAANQTEQGALISNLVENGLKSRPS